MFELLPWGGGVNDVPIVGEPVAYGVGFFVLMATLLSRVTVAYFHTFAHEGGHMLAGLFSFRTLLGFRMFDNTEAVTAHRGARWAFTNLVLLFSGYIAPPLLGLGGAALLAAGNPWAVLLGTVVLSALALGPARNGLAFLVPLLVVIGVGWALIEGSALLQAGVAVGIAWFLLISGTIEALILPARGGDAASLAQRTLIPGIVWKLAWIAIALYALVVGAQLLLRPGHLGG